MGIASMTQRIKTNILISNLLFHGLHSSVESELLLLQMSRIRLRIKYKDIKTVVAVASLRVFVKSALSSEVGYESNSLDRLIASCI